MPTRIMAWNIQDLTLKKLQPSDADPSYYRAKYILQSVLLSLNRKPDIFVVIEVETGVPDVRVGAQSFVVADNSGGPAVRLILNALRYADEDADWRVVPPMISGSERRKEGIAVFFNNDRVNFRGPLQLETFTVGEGREQRKSFQRASGIGGQAPTYLPPWENALPDQKPAGPDIGNGLKQNQLAGKVLWDNPHGQGLLNFPDAGTRSPFYTSFIEKGGAGRTINLMSVHLPPNTNKAAQAVTNLMSLPQMSGPMSVGEVRVLCGDFNINFQNPDRVLKWNPMIMRNIQRSDGTTTHFSMLNWTAPSLLKPVDLATLAGTPDHFDYMSSGWRVDRQQDEDDFLRLVSYDAIFAAFNAGSAPWPPGYVMNRVAGTPWTTNPTVTSAMDRSISDLQNWARNWHAPLVTQTDLFQRVENFGKIRGTSDHLAVYADV